MSDIREVTVDELRHLVSDRAIAGETMLLNMGPQHPQYTRCAALTAGTGWRNCSQLHTGYWFLAYRCGKEYGIQNLPESGGDDRSPGLFETRLGIIWCIPWQWKNWWVWMCHCGQNTSA